MSERLLTIEPIGALMQTDIKRTSVMLPAELHDRLSAQAREAERSLAAEIRLVLREHVTAQPVNGQPEPKEKER